ncbi:MAG: aminomethyl-transferring glycine dehydrogenase subunit GcvPA [Candidatus Krumholzibacteriota bacterium]|nr:aminomethyl-transferring glycine dehydrogenase subunit GcvPA [Candidatus Krumholzibacteriota bacterium]
MSYIQNTNQDREEMLKAIGVSSFEELLKPVSSEFRVKGGLDLPGPKSEAEVISELDRLAARNNPASSMKSFLGGGVYDRFIPAAVRYVLSRSEFYTSYTPYQAEVSQGTLQSIYEYQSMICGLTSMEVANASLYDGATAMAESILMACSVKRKDKVLVSGSIPGRMKSVLRSYTLGGNIKMEYIPFTEDGTLDIGKLKEEVGPDTAAVVMAQPNYFGVIEKAEEISSIARESGSLLVSYVDPVSLAVLTPPGEYGADIVVGEGQSFGLPQNFGGPLLGFIATKKKYVRKSPGRLISRTADVDGNTGYVMTLQTREQHIRRGRATSNICTNEGLCALAASVYLATLGEDGFREVALQSASKARTLYDMISGLPGCSFPFGNNFFQEFVIKLPVPADQFLKEARGRGVLAGISLAEDFPQLGDSAILTAVTERRSREDLILYRDLLSRTGGGK